MSVCLSVSDCLSVPCQTITFESLDVGSSYLHVRYYLPGVRFKFVYEGHPVKVKVTGAKKVKKFVFPQCKNTSIGNNSGSVKHEAMKFTCSMGFLDTAHGVSAIFVA